ncbi:MAG: hypothetical protein ABSH28_13670 [Acidobacteriota bacterium]|jgi:hypothetical protein
MSVGIGIGVEIAVAIGFRGLQKPIAIPIPTPILMIATQSEHDFRPDPYFLIKCPPIYELISNQAKYRFTLGALRFTFTVR